MSDQSTADAGLNRTALQLGLAVFFSMNVMVFTMALWSWDTYEIAASPNAAIMKDLLRLGCMLFASPVLIILGKPLAVSVYGQWQAGIVTADGLLLIGVVTAFVYSAASVLTGQPHVYFEVACMILLAVTLGRWLEAEGKHRAMKSLQSLQNLLPETVQIVGPHDTLQTIPLDEVTVGQTVRVLPGQRIPLDGIIQQGESYVDQQMVTGESEPHSRGVGDPVFGGTANLDGCLDIRVDADARSGLIQRLVESVREAASQISRPQRMADQLARIFVPCVILIALVVFVAQWRASDMPTALIQSMAVVLIACPCALAIATPLAIWAALGNAAGQGIVFRTSDDLTSLAEIDCVCVDKTGTLTTESPQFAAASYLEPADGPFADQVAVKLAAQTLHPLARALQKDIPNVDLPSLNIKVGPAKTVPGKGVTATFISGESFDNMPAAGTNLLLGSVDFCAEMQLSFNPALREARELCLAEGKSLVCVGWDGVVRALYAFHETLRTDAPLAMRSLQAMGLRTILLTGDQPRRAERIGKRLGMEVSAHLLPADKHDWITRLQADGHRVAMVGDGLNDAPALSRAHVGIALGCGAEVSREAADVCLIQSELTLLPWAIGLARSTRRTIRRNLIWAFSYNVVGIALAAAGKLNPIVAALAMVLSSAFVIAESLRLSQLPGPDRPPPDHETSATLTVHGATSTPTANEFYDGDVTDSDATQGMVPIETKALS